MTTLGMRAAGDFRHQVLFYRGTEEYLEGVIPFIYAGLALDEPVAVIVPGPNLRFILAALGADAEQVHPFDMMLVGRNPGRIIASVLLTFVDTYPAGRVRIVGEPVWAGRTAVEYPACAQHEALLNLAFADRPVTILCPYDAGKLDATALADAEATHPLLVDAGGERASSAYAPGRIITEYNRPFPPRPAPSLTFDATTLAQVRQLAREHATGLGLVDDHTELDLIVGELTANSVTHGGGSGALRIWTEQGYLVCEVRDAGHITDPLAGRRPAGRHQLSGRGLLLVNYLADLVRLHTTPQGTTVRVYLALPPPDAHPLTPLPHSRHSEPLWGAPLRYGGALGPQWGSP